MGKLFLKRASYLGRRRWYAALGLASMLLLILSACGGSSAAAGDSSNVPGVTNDTITIGGVLDTTGAIKVICQPILQGDQLYFDKINKAGGINGRKIKFVQVSEASACSGSSCVHTRIATHLPHGAVAAKFYSWSAIADNTVEHPKHK